MNLGEKIYKLRKEKRLSQEALAELLGTTRQAVSKWENNQGFPETEKLLLLANVFEVSTDFLLKDDKSVKETNERGYYVSKEMATAYLASENKMCRNIGLTFMLLALTGIPYSLFDTNSTLRYLGMAAFVIAGIVAFVISLFSEQEQYKVLKQEPLLFDYEYLKSLTNEYQSKRKKYVAVASICTTLFIVGLLILVLTVKGHIVWSEYHSFVFLGLAIGLFGFVYTAGIMETYELLIKNDEYSTRLLFKLRRKIKEKIDRL